MIKLKNITINDSIAECDVYPESCQERGYVTVDLKKEEIVSSFLPTEYDWCTSHLAHAKWKLIELSKAKDIPAEVIVMWY